MSIAILLITHEHIADNLLTTADNILNVKTENIAVVEVPMDTATEISIAKAEKIVSGLNLDRGLLLLSDLVGSTPFNIARSIKTQHPSSILVSGINLPMLLKVFNYREIPLAELADKALLGGQTGIDKHE